MDKHTENKQKDYKDRCIKIDSVYRLCEIIDTNYKELQLIMENLNDNYHIFMLKKRQGGYRQIVAPSDKLKSIHKRIYKTILSNINLDNSCMGFSVGTSIAKNASLHQSKEALLKLDLFRFFDTITYQRVLGLFKSMGYNSEVATCLAKLTTISLDDQYLDEIRKDKALPTEFPINNTPRLPQGAPTSPILSNIIATKLDIRLRNLAKKLNITYSRYADDIVFSGSLNLLPNYSIIQGIILEEGFFINTNKIVLKKQGQKQIVTGLTVTNGVHVPKQFKEQVKKDIYYCVKYGVKSHLERIGEDSELKFKKSLHGRIAHIYAIECSLGEKIFKEYNGIEWSV